MILHIDLDYFFAQVEELEYPELKGTPFAVGGAMRRGVICTCNYIARSYGVRSGMPGFKALEVCPQLKMLPVVMEKYVAASKRVFDVVYACSDAVEQVSIDEAYVKIDSKTDEEAIAIAKKIKFDVYKATGLTSSVGLSKNKLISKIVGAINKPNGFFFLSDDEIDSFIKKTHVKDLPGVGSVVLEKLKSIGVQNCGDLQNISLQNLVYHFGKFGSSLYSYCRGEDSRNIVLKRLERSISVESTTESDLLSLEECLVQIEFLYKKLFSRVDDLAKDRIDGVFIKITDTKFNQSSISRSSFYYNLDYFRRLFEKFYDSKGRPKLRLIGLGVNLGNSLTKQLTLEL